MKPNVAHRASGLKTSSNQRDIKVLWIPAGLRRYDVAAPFVWQVNCGGTKMASKALNLHNQELFLVAELLVYEVN